MLILTAVTDNIKVNIEGAHTTNALPIFAAYRDITATSFTPGRNLVNTNGATPVNGVPAPAASTQRVVDFMSILNRDTVGHTVTVDFDLNGTPYRLMNVTLAAGESLQYSTEAGFYVLSNIGARKQQQGFALGPVASGWNMTVLASPVINNEAVANTLTDVTGLAASLDSLGTWAFRFRIRYSAAAATTGSRWSINGPTFSALNYTSHYTLTATTETVNSAAAYDLPAASNANSLTAGNIAMIDGFITNTATGNLQARFASEITASAITALAGSYVEFMKIA